jgi:hypothetical protein
MRWSRRWGNVISSPDPSPADETAFLSSCPQSPERRTAPHLLLDPPLRWLGHLNPAYGTMSREKGPHPHDWLLHPLAAITRCTDAALSARGYPRGGVVTVPRCTSHRWHDYKIGWPMRCGVNTRVPKGTRPQSTLQSGSDQRCEMRCRGLEAPRVYNGTLW